MNKGLTKAKCVRKQKAKGKSLTDARIACKVKGTYKGERKRTGKRAFISTRIKAGDKFYFDRKTGGLVRVS